MPYPEDHPFRQAFADVHNLVENVLFEAKMTDGYWSANVGDTLTLLVGHIDLLAYAVEDMMNQIDFDPDKRRPLRNE